MVSKQTRRQRVETNCDLQKGPSRPRLGLVVILNILIIGGLSYKLALGFID